MENPGYSLSTLVLGTLGTPVYSDIVEELGNDPSWAQIVKGAHKRTPVVGNFKPGSWGELQSWENPSQQVGGTPVVGNSKPASWGEL